MKMTMYSLVVILVLAGTVVQSDAESRRRQASCQRIPRRSICSNVGYSETIFPNLLEHENLREAEESLETLLSGIASVVGTGDDCYHFLQTFLCQMHVPKCLSPGSVSLPPCREMCMMLWDRCGTTMRTIPQLSIIDCEMLRYSSGDKAIQNCTPLSEEVEDVVCCPRPFRNVGGACVKILKKARPYRSSVKSCESEGASLAKFAPTSEIHDFLEEELSGNSDMVWVGIERSNDELTWTFDGTSLGPEYLQSEGLAQLADGSTRSKKTCFALRNYEEVVTADCRTSDAPSLCQISNECPYGISSTPRGQYTPQGHEDGEGGSVPEGGEPPETKDFVPLPESGECEPQDMALCRGLHPQTRFPNSLAHENAKDAEMELRRWAPLIGIGCSPHMKELLCGLYAPPCSSVEERALLPCREVCNAAKDGCLPTMQSFNQDWPEIINCTRFPAYDGDGSCDMGSLGAPDTAVDETQSCLPLEDPICNHFYDTTTFPNAFGHTDPVEASMALNMFQSLILLDCSPDIEHFLCGMLYPFCSDAVDGPIPPCRELCESTKTGCDIYISFVGEDWPPELNCSALPWSNSTDALCMGASPNAAAGSEHTREPGTDTETDEDPDDMEGSQMNGQCEPLRIPSCMDMPYNYTQMSTRTQEEVEAEMANFAPLVQLGCSPALLQFMCAMSAPPCTVLDIPMVPCKEMCTAALEGCEDLFEQVNMTDSFPCDMLPSRDSGLCVFVEPGDKRPDGPKDDSGDCQPLEIDVCKGQGYTHTSFPNYMLHQTQAEAGQMATLFSLLVDFGECGIELLAYSCQLLAPRCLGDPMERVPPCINRCHRVQDLCGAMLEESDFSDVLDCAILEVYGSHCEDSEIGSLPAVNETDTVESETPPSLCKPMESHMCAELGFTQTGWGLEPTTIHNDPIVMSMVSTMCSPLLLPMTCSVATPYCDPQSGDVRVPCREICRDILKSCKKTIKAMGIEPPDMLSCKQYPSAGDNNCMMDIASPLKAKITDYARTETLLTLNVEQPEESFDKAGRGMSGYRVFHDTGVFEQMADGSLTEISFALSLEQSGRDIVVTVVPFNAFGEGPAADVLTTTETSVIPPHGMQLTMRPAESGVYQPHLSSNIYLLCTNTEEHVMAYPEWSRDGSVIEVEGVKYDGYKTMRYGDRSTLLEISGFDMSMFSAYTCSLEGEEKEIIVAPPCADALPSFNPMECSYFAYRLITDSMPVDVVLFGHECVDEIDDLVCSTYLASCDDPDPASCHGECRADLARCRDFSLPITPYSPCVGFPAGGFCSSGQPEPEPEPETEPEPTAGTRAEPTPEPETGPVAEPTPETETKPMAEPTPESEPEPVTMNMPEPVPTIVNESETPSAAQPPVTLKKRRYDIVNQGVRAKFQGWADVQGQGAANDYCRVLKFKKKRNYLACALAGSEDETGYTSPDIRSGDFDEGFRDTWYMKDEDGDGRDDFCRCVNSDDGSTYVSCMRAGETGFEGHYDFTPTVSVTPTDCAKIRVSPFLGHPQDSN